LVTLVKRPEDSTLSKRFLLPTMGVETESVLLTKAEGWGAKALVLAHTRAKELEKVRHSVSKHIRLAQSSQLGRDYIDLLLKTTYLVIDRVRHWWSELRKVMHRHRNSIRTVPSSTDSSEE
jgi:hypothetical protein